MIRSPKILKSLSRFNVIIVDLEKIVIGFLNLKQLVLGCFKSVAFFGYPISIFVLVQ